MVPLVRTILPYSAVLKRLLCEGISYNLCVTLWDTPRKRSSANPNAHIIWSSSHIFVKQTSKQDFPLCRAFYYPLFRSSLSPRSKRSPPFFIRSSNTSIITSSSPSTIPYNYKEAIDCNLGAFLVVSIAYKVVVPFDCSEGAHSFISFFGCARFLVVNCK